MFLDMYPSTRSIPSIATGGKIVAIHVVPQEGGLTLTKGGNPFFVLSAGYLGSLIWGGLILQGALRTKIQPQLAVALGAVLGVVTLLYVRPVVSFGFIFGLLTTAAMIFWDSA